MHKIIPNNMFVWANDASGRPGCLRFVRQSWIYMACGSPSPVGLMRTGFWQSRVKVASCCLTLSRAKPCRFSAICPCSSFLSARLVKTSQNGSPRWSCMTATAEGMLGDAESYCAFVAIIQSSSPLHRLPASTPSQLRDSDVTTCCHPHQTDPCLGISS